MSTSFKRKLNVLELMQQGAAKKKQPVAPRDPPLLPASLSGLGIDWDAPFLIRSPDSDEEECVIMDEAGPPAGPGPSAPAMPL